MIIAFTLGHTKSYDEAINSNTSVNKLGKSEDYDGGCIWKNKEEAEAFLKSSNFSNIKWEDGNNRNANNFSIYGVIINNWDEKTVYKLNENDLYHHLLVDSKLCKI